MTSLSDAATRILAAPAPVLVLDTCSLLDLFRRHQNQPMPKTPPEEYRDVWEMGLLLSVRPGAIHLVVPELVPREYADNANAIEVELNRWCKQVDESLRWFTESAGWLRLEVPPTVSVQSFGVAAECRQLADDLLGRAMVLDRDRDCLDRAVGRVIAKKRPSHAKEIKDSMNLEQTLELCRRLNSAGFDHPRYLVSSNTHDFAASSSSTTLHPDLQQEFAAVGLEYVTSIRAAYRKLNF